MTSNQTLPAANVPLNDVQSQKTLSAIIVAIIESGQAYVKYEEGAEQGNLMLPNLVISRRDGQHG